VVVVALQLARCVAAETAVAGPLRAIGASSMPVSQRRGGIAVGVAEWLDEPSSVCDGRSVQHIRSKGQIAELGAFIAKPLQMRMAECYQPDHRPARGSDDRASADLPVKSSDVEQGGRVVLWGREGGRKKLSFQEIEPETRRLSARGDISSAGGGGLAMGLSVDGDQEIHLSRRMIPICAGLECADTSLRAWISARWAA
jgi:hypothetical protein